MRFVLGELVVTSSVASWMTDDARTDLVERCVERHADGDWGDLRAHDASLNDDAVRSGGVVYSKYRIHPALGEEPGATHLLVVTDANRSVTTIMFAGDD